VRMDRRLLPPRLTFRLEAVVLEAGIERMKVKIMVRSRGQLSGEIGYYSPGSRSDSFFTTFDWKRQGVQPIVDEK